MQNITHIKSIIAIITATIVIQSITGMEVMLNTIVIILVITPIILATQVIIQVIIAIGYIQVILCIMVMYILIILCIIGKSKMFMYRQLLMIGGTEIFIIAGIVLLLFGGKKIPELMRSMGQGVRYFKKGVNEDLPEEKKEHSNLEVQLPEEENKQ